MPTPASRSALPTALVISAAVALLVMDARTPPAPLAATVSPRLFSAERASRHVNAIASRPHPVASAVHEAVREYIVAELRKLGLEPELQATTGIGTRGRTAARVTNVIARVAGTGRGSKAILVAAHYDGVPSGPAAGDDGAGVAAILEMLRALRTGPPIANDLIICITDGEEMGLLGASAFVNEHRWAKDVALVLDFEARGTTGRSMMFETGANNLDVIRTLRTVSNVSATSMMVTVYRNLPNDTDLSEFARLGQPALNFAFIGGVTRYHTPFDDPAHLDAGSLQHHGQQLLALVERFGREPLPRPATPDAVFFDLPMVGIVLYPESWALPIALLVVIVAVSGGVRSSRDEPRRWRSAALGAAGMIVAAAAAFFANGWLARTIVWLHATRQWDGEPGWAGVYAVALALVALTIAAAAWSGSRHWAGARGAWLGALLLWCVPTMLTAVMLPGVSYLFAWPLAGAGVLAWSMCYEGRVSEANGWAGVVLALAVLSPVIAMIGGYALPLDQLGAPAAALFVVLTCWLLAPKLEDVIGMPHARGLVVMSFAALGVLCYAMATVRRSDMAPKPVVLAYVMNADSGRAWLATSARETAAGSWAASVLGSEAEQPAGLSATSSNPALATLARSWMGRGKVRRVERLPLAASTVQVTSATTSPKGTVFELHVHVPADAQGASFRLIGAKVASAKVDGRVVDMTRYRDQSPEFSLTYLAPGSDGLTLSLDVIGAAAATLDVSTLRFGVPMEALHVPPRPANVVQVHSGDQTIVVQRVTLARP